MKKHPLRHAFEELSLADKAYRKMVEICFGEFTEYERCWRDFLGRIERFWMKTEAATQHLPGWQALKSDVEQHRKNDPVLLYLKHARNADEHSVQDLAHEWDAKLVAFQIENRIHASWQPWDRPLLPVNNRGVVYQPPRMHLGQTIEPLLGQGKPEPIVVAELAMVFYLSVFNRACDIVGDTRDA